MALEQAELGEDSLSGAVFAFVNRRGNYIKVLAWDRTGYCLFAKKAEQGRFMAYWFDRAGRLKSIEVEPDDGLSDGGIRSQRTQYRYDAQGRRTLRILADGREERTSYDPLGRVVVDGSRPSGDLLQLKWEERLAYDADDRVTSVRPGGVRADPAEAELQKFAYDEAGRLVSWEQGRWDGSETDPGIAGARTAQHAWRRDELGNWRKHRDSEAEPWLTPEVGPINEYRNWPVPGESVPLVREYDPAGAFVWTMGTGDGAELRFRHDALDRLVGVEDGSGRGLRCERCPGER